jgi:hypothetical protein
VLRLLSIILLLSVWAQPGRAQTPIVVSPSADATDITFYRGIRGAEEAINFDPDDDEPLKGYVMITETRTVDLPAGEAIVRFEGVASGIIPQSAILLNQADLKEKNFDSRLLSQRGLLDAFTGQSITIRRTDSKTGKVTLEAGTIRSNPDSLVIQTKQGFEAVNCDGTMNTVLFPGKPVDLTAKPTLSLTTRGDQKGGRVTLVLGYLAGNFDWQANYVGTFSADGKEMRLFGWMTLASRDKTSFASAAVSAVAGMLARAQKTYEEEEAEEEEREKDPYAEDNIEPSYSCWPAARTSPSGARRQLFTPGSIATVEAPIAVRMNDYGYSGGGGGGCGGDEDENCDQIIVTGSRRIERADLGDLKLYTIPFKTSVPSQSFKQVRFLPEKRVKGEILYRTKYRDEDVEDVELMFRFANKKSNGAGNPLPTGQVSLFQMTTRGRHLVGETFIQDKARDEEVDFKIAEPDNASFDIDVESDEIESGDNWSKQELTVENENDHPVVFEAELSDSDDYRLSRFSDTVKRKNGKYVWRVTVPANSALKLNFRSTEVEDKNDDE